MFLGRQVRPLSVPNRRRSLKKHLRLEHLEHRKLFAGLSPIAVNDLYHAVSNETLEIAASGVLANDTDTEGDTLQALEFRGPAHGALELNPDGSFAYTPATGFSGTDGFIYQVDDGGSRSRLAVVTIQVTGANSPPQGNADNYTIAEDVLLSIGSTHGVLANDSDVDGDTLQTVLGQGPEHGTLQFNEDGSFTYQPDDNFNGLDSFTYKVNDGIHTSDLITVNLTVEAINDAPSGENDQYSTNEDVPLTIAVDVGVLANDSDVDDEPLQAKLSVGPEHGTLELSSNGSFTYTPNENYHGTDAFIYQVDDGQALSQFVVVELLVNPVNDVPISRNDEYAIDEDQPLVIAATAGVLVNDSDVDGDVLQAVLGVGPEHGTLELNPDGSFTYTPDENYNGPDAFTYQVNDGTATSDLAVVEILVNAVNDTPVSQNDEYVTEEDQPLVIAAAAGVIANDSDVDGDTLQATLGVGPEHGTLVLNPDGSFSYTPNENYNGPDSFTYQVSDGTELSDLAVVEILVNAVNDTPVSQNDEYVTAEDQPLVIAATAGVLVNDSDVDGDTLQATLDVGPEHGTLIFNPDGSFTYTPDENYHGPDSFTYRVGDGNATSELATVEIDVTPVNDIPQAVADNYTTDKDQTLTVAAPGVLGNDVDVDGDALTAILVAQPQHGTLQWAADGSFVYVPEAGYTGQDEFTYRASDGMADTIAVVSIRVGGENVRPVAANDVYRIDAGGEITIDIEDGVLANDSDVNDDPLTAILYRGPQHGTLALNSDGSFQYKPAAGFSGLDSFLYRANDGELNSRLAVVNLRVQAVEALTATSATARASDNSSLPPVGARQSNSATTTADAHDAALSTMDLENLLLTELDELVVT
jgi:VCBS repeat-containing protein